MSPRLHILAAALIFSTGGAAIKATTLTNWQVAGLRSGVAALVLASFLPAARRRWTPTILAVALSYALTLISFVSANKLTTSASAIFLQSTAPLYVVLLAPLLLHERVRPRDLVFMMLLGLGMSLFFIGASPPLVSAPNPWLGNVVAAASGLWWAVTVMGLRWLGRRPGADGSAPLVAAVAGNTLAFLLCLAPGWPLAAMTPLDGIVVLYLGVVQIGVAYVLLTAAIRHIPAIETSLLLLVEPVLNPIWAWVVQGETPTLWSIAGGAVIIGGTAAKTWADARPALPIGPRESSA